MIPENILEFPVTRHGVRSQKRGNHIGKPGIAAVALAGIAAEVLFHSEQPKLQVFIGSSMKLKKLRLVLLAGYTGPLLERLPLKVALLLHEGLGLLLLLRSYHLQQQSDDRRPCNPGLRRGATGSLSWKRRRGVEPVLVVPVCEMH
ncbi:hypothetical protein PC123_g7276 [Phytophthora cactorum]|nr:hypothetical protein PC123_g7276 [Phytophthora cactorum]